MGIAFVSRSPLGSILLAPLQTLRAWLLPLSSARSPLRRSAPAGHPTAIKNIAPNFGHTRAIGQKPCHSGARAGAPRRLKIVREFDAGIAPSCAGRMVISGRMADVCAELERMSQREAAAAAA